MNKNTRAMEENDSDYIAEMEDIQGQMQYGEMIVSIGEGESKLNGTGYELISREQDQQLYQLNRIETYIDGQDEERALRYLFPNGFSSSECRGTTILAATNAIVDKWNQAVQDMNTNPLLTLTAKDKF